MASSEIPYDIYRVYDTDSEAPKLKIARDMSGFAKAIISTLNLPYGVTIDGISVKPELLIFESEILLKFEDA
jgi:hypothetical protein